MNGDEMGEVATFSGSSEVIEVLGVLMSGGGLSCEVCGFGTSVMSVGSECGDGRGAGVFDVDHGSGFRGVAADGIEPVGGGAVAVALAEHGGQFVGDGGGVATAVAAGLLAVKRRPTVMAEGQGQAIGGGGGHRRQDSRTRSADSLAIRFISSRVIGLASDEISSNAT